MYGLCDLAVSIITHLNIQLGTVQTQMQSKGGFAEQQVPSSLTPSGKPVVSYRRSSKNSASLIFRHPIVTFRQGSSDLYFL